MIMSPVVRPVAAELHSDIGANEVFTAVGVDAAVLARQAEALANRMR